MTNHFMPHSITNRNHPISLLGQNEHYFVSKHPEYKNYKYERLRLRNTDFEFFMELPLDKIHTVVVARAKKSDQPSAAIPLEEIVQKHKAKIRMSKATLEQEMKALKLSL